MIVAIYRMVRARRGHAATVFGLAALAIAASVAAPVYLLAAGRSLVAAEVAAATPREVVITAQQSVLYAPPVNGGAPVPSSEAFTFENGAADAVRTPGFQSTYAADTRVVVGLDQPDIAAGSIVEASARENACGHVVVSLGRCPGGPNEILVGDTLARTVGLAPGATLVLQAIQLLPSGSAAPPQRVPGGPPRPMSVVGVYHPTDPAAAFWGLDVLDDPLDAAQLPILMDLPTLVAFPHSEEVRSIVAVPLPGTIAADRIDQLRADLDTTLVSHDGIIPSTGLLSLLGGFDAERQTLKVVPTFAAGALVVLCWFVIYLAMAHTTEARRGELGLMKLRGVSGLDQTWLALAENVVALVAGGVVGYFLGHAAIWLVAQTVLPVPVSVPVTLAPLMYAALTLFGAIAAGVVALRRDLVSPALDLMRRVPSRLRRTRGAIVAIVMTALAAAAVLQLHSDSGGLGGLAVLAPALVLLAGGLVLSRLLDPIAGWSGRRALRRGRIAPALAALHFARRGAGARALALLVVAVALFGYAATAAETADRVRTDQVRQSIAADRVLSVGLLLPARLITAVRQVDPDGRYSMAVVVHPDERRGTLLAVDSPRLAAVTIWPDTASVAVGGVSAKLRPPVADPVTVTGRQLVLTVTSPNPTPGRSVNLRMWVMPANGEHAISVLFPPIRPGQADYRADVPCTDGCQLGDLSVQQSTVINDGSVAAATPVSQEATVYLNGLRQAGPDRDLVSAANFGTWNDRSLGALRLAPAPTGLEVGVIGVADRPASIGPPDTPAALPMLAAGGRYLLNVKTIADTDVPATPIDTMASLPRTGAQGAIVDLEYYARYTDNATPTTGSQVWLNDKAPADIVDRLRQAGLTITGDRRLATDLTTAGQRPEAIGLDFFLGVAVLGVILGVAGLWLVAGIERRARSDELRNLHVQGLTRRAVRSAGLRSYLLLAVPASLGGALVAELAWILTRSAIPTGEQVSSDFALVVPGARAWFAWGAAAVVLIVAAVVLGEALARAAIRVQRGVAGSTERSTA